MQEVKAVSLEMKLSKPHLFGQYLVLTRENEIGPSLLLATKFTGSSKLYNLFLQAFEHPIDRDNCYTKITGCALKVE